MASGHSTRRSLARTLLNAASGAAGARCGQRTSNSSSRLTAWGQLKARRASSARPCRPGNSSVTSCPSDSTRRPPSNLITARGSTSSTGEEMYQPGRTNAKAPESSAATLRQAEDSGTTGESQGQLPTVRRMLSVQPLARIALPSGMPIEHLVQRAQGGDPTAWDEIVRRHHSLVWATVRTHRLSHADAQDAVQETWIRLARS